MLGALTLVQAVTPVPTPSPSAGFDPNSVTPGPLGFLVVFAIAVLTVLLILDMTRRVRRARYRGEIRERLDREPPSGSSDPVDPVAP